MRWSMYLFRILHKALPWSRYPRYQYVVTPRYVTKSFELWTGVTNIKILISWFVIDSKFKSDVGFAFSIKICKLINCKRTYLFIIFVSTWFRFRWYHVHNVNYTLYIVHRRVHTRVGEYVLYIAHYTLYVVQCTLYIVQCTLYIVHCTLYIVHCTLYIVQCTVYIVHCTLYIVHCTLYRLHCTLPRTNSKYPSQIMQLYI